MKVDPTREATHVAVVVRIPGELREALKQRAAKEDRSVASLLRLAARTYLDNQVP